MSGTVLRARLRDAQRTRRAMVKLASLRCRSCGETANDLRMGVCFDCASKSEGKAEKKADMVKLAPPVEKRAEALEALRKFAKAKEEKPSVASRAAAYLPLAGVGAAIGLGKGYAQGKMKEHLTRLEGAPTKLKPGFLKHRFSKATSEAIAKGVTGGASTLLIGVTMADMLRRLKQRTREK